MAEHVRFHRRTLLASGAATLLPWTRADAQAASSAGSHGYTPLAWPCFWNVAVAG
jgi:hypothetical protein